MNQVIYVEPRAHRLLGLMLIVLLHLVVIYLLAISLTRELAKPEPEPIEMLIIQKVTEIQPEIKSEVQPMPVATKPTIKNVVQPVERPPTVTAVQPLRNVSAPVLVAESVKASSVPPAGPVAPIQVKGETRGVMGSASANCPTPNYPQTALMSEEQGLVRLLLNVGENGRVTGAKVIKSSGSSDLDRAATSAYKHCVFNPAMQDGITVASTIKLEYEFKID